MSSAFAQRSAGMVGVRGAPRPTLLKAVGDLSAGEHESAVTTTSETTTARIFFNSCMARLLTPLIGVQGSGFRVQRSVQGSRFRVRFIVQGSTFGSRFSVRFIVQSSRFGSEFRGRGSWRGCGRAPSTENPEPRTLNRTLNPEP